MSKRASNKQNLKDVALRLAEAARLREQIAAFRVYIRDVHIDLVAGLQVRGTPGKSP